MLFTPNMISPNMNQKSENKDNSGFEDSNLNDFQNIRDNMINDSCISRNHVLYNSNFETVVDISSSDEYVDSMAPESSQKNTILNNLPSDIEKLCILRKKFGNKLIIGNLNINSISNKFDQLKLIVQGQVDILVITETKIDNSFLANQFLISGFSKPFRLDRNRRGGGILLYIREDIPSKDLLLHNLPDDIEGMFVEITLRKKKWLLFASYHPPSQSDDYYFQCVSNALLLIYSLPTPRKVEWVLPLYAQVFRTFMKR